MSSCEICESFKNTYFEEYLQVTVFFLVKSVSISIKSTDRYLYLHPDHIKRSAVYSQSSEAVAQSCSVKKVLLKISQNSQENSCARVSF